MDEAPARRPSSTSALDELVIRCLDALEEGGAPALETVLAAEPELGNAARARLSELESIGLLKPENTPEGIPLELGDYRLVRKLGSGGMGIVYRAHQRSLERDVALKLVRPDLALFEGTLDRFRREIGLAAKLQHPSIVRIYAIGAEHGIPFYAMELVPGCSIGDLLEQLAGRDPTRLGGADIAAAVAARGGEPAPRGELPEAFQGAWPDICVRIIRQVLLGLEHAHKNRVVHRDVKPSNVLLTPDGRALLTDFGLATEEGVTRLTRSGAALGSLPYMSPEQVRGEPADTRSDLYSVGVCLYEMLSLALPFGDRSAESVRQSILQARARPLRQVNPSASWELETICLVAMDPDPRRRYASSADFARDLGHVLAGRPIEARRPGVVLRASRWCVRHPGWAVGAALGTLLLVVTPSALLWQQQRANARMEQANLALTRALADAQTERERAEQERVRAEGNLDRAVEAVDEMLVQVGRFDLEDMPDMEPVRRRLLERALALFEGLVSQRPGDQKLPLLQLQIEEARSSILQLLGRDRDAIAGSRAAIERVGEPLAESDPARARLIGALWADVGASHWHVGELNESEQALLHAIEILERVRAAHAPSRTVLQNLASAGTTLGQVQQYLGKLEPALATLERAIAWGAEADAGATEWPLNLYLARQVRAALLQQHGRNEEALEAFRAAREGLQERKPESTEERYAYAVGMSNFGGLLNDLGRPAEARPLLDAALREAEALVALHPKAQRHKVVLASALANLARTQLALGELAAGRASGERVLELLHQSALERPEEAETHFKESLSAFTLAQISQAAGDPREVWLGWHRRCHAAVDEALRMNPKFPLHRMHSVGRRANLAEQLLKAGWDPLALELLEEAEQKAGGSQQLMTSVTGNWIEAAQATLAVAPEAERDAAARRCEDHALGCFERALELGLPRAEAERMLAAEPLLSSRVIEQLRERLEVLAAAPGEAAAGEAATGEAAAGGEAAPAAADATGSGAGSSGDAPGNSSGHGGG